MFPTSRPRRLRRTEAIRRMVRETRLSADDLILPLFIVPGSGVRREISSMPGNYHLSVDQLGPEVDRIMQARLPGVLLFGLPEHKDECGSEAWAEGGVVQQAAREIKRLAPELCVITDVCLCEYTSHGHCGELGPSGEVLNDATLALLTKTAVSHAQAGADIVAPSDMMDGRVGAVRAGLDEAGLENTPIMSYAVKYASGFYGPFREAADSARNLATAAPIRWTHPMRGRPCGRRPWMWKRAPTSSWSSRPCRTWTSSAKSPTCPRCR